MKMLKEKKSINLGVNYIYLEELDKFLCENGVLFTREDLENDMVTDKEYERRAKEDMLYDYNYAKNTGILRNQKGRTETGSKERNDTEGLRENFRGMREAGKTLNESVMKYRESTRKLRVLAGIEQENHS